MTDIDKKRSEIRVGLGKLRLSARPDPLGINRPSFLSPDDIEMVCQYLHENNVAIKVGDTSFNDIKEVEPLIREK